MSIVNTERSETYIKLLPPEIRNRISTTQKEWKTLILENLESVLSSNDDLLITHWVENLNMYVATEVFTFTIEEVEKIAQICYHFIVTSQLFHLVVELIPTFIIIVDPYIKINVTFDWRPIYNQLFKYGLSSSKRKSRKVTNIYLQLFFPFIESCQRFFPPGATEEILEEFSHLWNPKGPLYSLGCALVCLFLPVNQGKHDLWFDDIISKYALFDSIVADFIFLPIFAKLSYQPISEFNWSPHVPFFFHKLAIFLQIPVTPIGAATEPPEESSLNFDGAQFFIPEEIDSNEIHQKFGQLFINLLSTSAKEAIKEHLTKLLLLIAPLHSPLPQNASEKVINLTMEFLNVLILLYCKRVKSDRRKKNLIPALTEDDHQWFVSSILPVYILELYGNSKCEQLNQLVQLMPSVAIPTIFDTLQRLTDYQHLKEPALRTMYSIAPTVVATKEMLEPFKIILTPFVNDITSSDVETSVWVFKLFKLFAWCTPIDESLSDWAFSVARQCVNYCASAVGEDFEKSLVLMEMALSSISRAVEPQVYKGMIQIVENSLNDLPINNMNHLIDSLEPNAYGKWCFNELTERNVAITKCLVRSSLPFINLYKEKILKFIKQAILSEDKKIRIQTYSLTKWTIRAFVRAILKLPKVQGVSAINENSVIWNPPTEESVNSAITLINDIFPVIKDLFARDGYQHQRYAIKLTRACVKGIICAASGFDYEMAEKDPEKVALKKKRFPHASMFQYTFPSASKKAKELIEWLISIVSPDLHHKVISDILVIFSNAVVPVDYLAYQDKDILSHIEEIWLDTRLSTLLPSDQALLPIHNYWLALKFYSSWLQSMEFPFTEFSKSIIDCAMKFILSPFPSVRDSLTTFFMHVIKAYPNEITAYENQFKAEFSSAFKTAPVQALSTISLIVGVLSVTTVSIENFHFIVDIALVICQPMPPDVPDDWIRVLRNTIAVIFDGNDFTRSPFNVEEIYQERLRLVKGIIEKAKKYPNSQDTQNYALGVICAVIEGDPLIIDTDVAEFILPFLNSEDSSISEITIQTVSNLVEQLIPRDPFPKDRIKDKITNNETQSEKQQEKTENKDNEEENNEDDDLVTPACEKFNSIYDDLVRENVDKSNYDDFYFSDMCIKKSKNYISRIMNREESNDSKFLSKYFPSNTINQRIALHKVLYNYFVDDPEFSTNLMVSFVNNQTHDEETFYYRHYIFWRSIIRFFGCEFIKKIIEICVKINQDDLATIYVISEVVSGMITAFKCFKYEQIETIKPLLFDLLKLMFTSQNTNSTFSWFMIITSAISAYDARRYFWLFDFMKTLQFENTPKGFRQRGEIAKVLTYFTNNSPEKFSEVFPKYVDSLFSSKVMKLDSHRNTMIDFLVSMFDTCLTKDWIEQKKQFFYDYILPADDRFIARLIIELFHEHSFWSISAMPLCIDNIEEWTKSLIEDKDQEEQELGIRALSTLMISGIVPAVAKLPLTKQTAKPVILRVLEQLTLSNDKNWPAQVNVLVQLLLFLSSSFFLIDDSLVEAIIWDVISPALLHPNSEVQDSASILLSFIFKSFGCIRAKITVFSTMFEKMLTDEDSTQRIAGAKGLFAVVWSTLIFDDVPDYITSAFSALQDAAETDSTVTDVINQFFSEFWSDHEENFTENAAIQLSPYKDSLRPSYIT
ncbi:hypothetical protein TRFO_31333 [Tritrichomonas foetus]|uniref:Proteasome activator complex subunit 4-like HEAT repeat-like domain-containing protein n=1 Tax=Tritrichomonas foetus TaxID=1144522 RepID=A0A1J4JRR8_9EUKA|nr:hypothetical protein TRFO_31333 [Tritrichomonas foetus]|eukprot:OHT01723.1 hypothetical protein TRFO_31333 [Tritrichomonas foetus]